MGLGQTTTILFEDEDGVLRPVSSEHPLPTAGGGTGGGAVDSVNGQTGVVVLTTEDIEVYMDGEPIGSTISYTLLSLSNNLQGLYDDLPVALAAKLDVPTGTPSPNTFAAGDGTWKTPPNTTYSVVSQANIENPASTASGLVTGQRLAQGVAANLPDNLVESSNASVSSIEMYATEDDLPAVGVPGTLYIVPRAE